MDLVWRERKKNWCGLPWTFTVYSFDTERFFINSGFLNRREDEVRLYRILDMSITETLFQRIFGLGTIHIMSSDKSLKNFNIENIRNAHEVKETLSNFVEKERTKKRVSTRELVGGMDDDDEGFFG